MPYEYHATVKDIVDGDTLIIDIDLGFKVILFDQSVRLYGIDTPESRTSDKAEKVFGLVSKEFTKKFVESCKNVVIVRTHLEKTTDDSREKFGRLLVEIINPLDKKILNEELVNEHMAVKYFGENKLNINAEHLKNRKILIDSGIVKL